jgi:hypothetical protein
MGDSTDDRERTIAANTNDDVTSVPLVTVSAGLMLGLELWNRNEMVTDDRIGDCTVPLRLDALLVGGGSSDMGAHPDDSRLADDGGAAVDELRKLLHMQECVSCVSLVNDGTCSKSSGSSKVSNDNTDNGGGSVSEIAAPVHSAPAPVHSAPAPPCNSSQRFRAQLQANAEAQKSNDSNKSIAANLKQRDGATGAAPPAVASAQKSSTTEVDTGGNTVAALAHALGPGHHQCGHTQAGWWALDGGGRVLLLLRYQSLLEAVLRTGSPNVRAAARARARVARLTGTDEGGDEGGEADNGNTTAFDFFTPRQASQEAADDDDADADGNVFGMNMMPTLDIELADLHMGGMGGMGSMGGMGGMNMDLDLEQVFSPMSSSLASWANVDSPKSTTTNSEGNSPTFFGRVGLTNDAGADDTDAATDAATTTGASTGAACETSPEGSKRRSFWEDIGSAAAALSQGHAAEGEGGSKEAQEVVGVAGAARPFSAQQLEPAQGGMGQGEGQEWWQGYAEQFTSGASDNTADTATSSRTTRRGGGGMTEAGMDVVSSDEEDIGVVVLTEGEGQEVHQVKPRSSPASRGRQQSAVGAAVMLEVPHLLDDYGGLPAAAPAKGMGWDDDEQDTWTRARIAQAEGIRKGLAEGPADEGSADTDNGIGSGDNISGIAARATAADEKRGVKEGGEGKEGEEGNAEGEVMSYMAQFASDAASRFDSMF